MADAAVAAIQFALETEDGLTFLHLWNEGDFDTLRREWPDAPNDIYEGADPSCEPVYKAIPHPKLKRDYADHTVRTTEVLVNGWGEMPKGLIGVITHQSPKGSSITFEACPCCNVKATVSAVPMGAIEFIERVK